MIRSCWELLTSRWTLVAILLLISMAWITTYDYLSDDPQDRSQNALQQLLDRHPEARLALAPFLDDARQQRALRVAAFSTLGDDNQYSLLADMAEEARTTQRMPYQARLAALIADRDLVHDAQQRQAFLMSHATTAQALFETGQGSAVQDWLLHLEQAAADDRIWPIVMDDPIALILWKQDLPLELLRFYHQHRDWLQEALLDIDSHSDPDQDTVDIYAALIRTAQRWPQLAQRLVQEDDMGGLGLALLAEHGTLIEACVESHHLDPSEVAAVIYANPDRFGQPLEDAQAVRCKAVYLASLYRDKTAVWYAAMSMPLALRLERDAPHLADQVLTAFGADDITVLLYAYAGQGDDMHPQARRIVSRLAESLLHWGDATIWILAHYLHMEDSRQQIVDALLHPDIGLRLMPFLISQASTDSQTPDAGLDRLHNDPRWARRYFTEHGDPIDQAWWENLPGGALVGVLRRWSQGLPNEWSELGWAAMDVGLVALTVASLGKAAPATAALTSATGARAAGTTGRVAAHAAFKTAVRSSSRVAARKVGVAYRLGSAGRLARLGRNLALIGRLAAKPIVGVYRFGRAAASMAVHGVTRTIHAWRGLSASARLWVLRGFLAAGLVTTVMARTAPNLDRIARGLGELAGNMVRGTVRMAGELLHGAVEGLTGEPLHEVLRDLGRWLPPLLMVMLLVFWMRRRRPRYHPVVA